MLKIYKPISGLDWMNYRLVKKDITFHHIVKRENGGLASIDNGALLMPTAHQYLHIIEYKDIDAYIILNKIFQMVNAQKREPTEEQREMVEYVLKDFEARYSTENNAKGKRLIKEEYLMRL